MSSTDKPKETRLQEGITILKKLSDFGLNKNETAFKEIQDAISEWVKTGEAVQKKIPMLRHGRIAELTLPRVARAVAELVLRVAS